MLTKVDGLFFSPTHSNIGINENDL